MHKSLWKNDCSIFSSMIETSEICERIESQYESWIYINFYDNYISINTLKKQLCPKVLCFEIIFFSLGALKFEKIFYTVLFAALEELSSGKFNPPPEKNTPHLGTFPPQKGRILPHRYSTFKVHVYLIKKPKIVYLLLKTNQFISSFVFSSGSIVYKYI